MLDFEQQANQAQALASLDEDWHLLEGKRHDLRNSLIYIYTSLSLLLCYSAIDTLTVSVNFFTQTR